MDLTTLAFLAVLGAQEGNPCQASLAVNTKPDQLAFTIEDIDKAGVTTLEYVIFVNNGSTEPQDRQKIPRPQLQNTPFINCFTLDFTPPSNLVRDGKTQYVVVARTEGVDMKVSGWSASSNPFTLGTVIPPPPPPSLPVPGVRVGTKTSA
jgi:hypothetical protein